VAAAPALAPGTVWAQCSTVGPDALAPLVAFADTHGLHLVDAPVMGTRQPAEAGQLTVLAAGPAAARPLAAAVFDAVGGKTLWLDEDAASGAASRLKLVVNNWVLTLVNGTAEALSLAQGLGVAPQAFLDAVAGGGLDVPYLQSKGRTMLGGDFAANFTVDAALKDARLVVAAAEEAGLALDLAAASSARLERAAASGHGSADFSASYLVS
jgi:3-hydroxyisobutyrate dehydrogenase